MLITFEKLQNLYPDLADIYREADQIIRYDRSCSTCHAKEDAVKLKACSGCICSPNPTLYCVSSSKCSDQHSTLLSDWKFHQSRTCQRAHWISHKVECLDTRDKYQDRNPKSWELRQEKRAFKMFAIALRANFSVFVCPFLHLYYRFYLKLSLIKI